MDKYGKSASVCGPVDRWYTASLYWSTIERAPKDQLEWKSFVASLCARVIKLNTPSDFKYSYDQVIKAGINTN